MHKVFNSLLSLIAVLVVSQSPFQLIAGCAAAHARSDGVNESIHNEVNTWSAGDKLFKLASNTIFDRAGPSPHLLKSVRTEIAKYFGVPLSDVSVDTDLIRDLRADPQDAFEVIAIICEKNGVVSPNREGLTTVRQIAEYLLQSTPDSSTTVFPAEGTRSLKGELPSSRHFSLSTESKQKDPIYVQEIFYATDRKPEKTRYYSGARAPQGELSYGICEVSIPVNVHKRGHLEGPSLARLEWRKDPKKHIVLQKVKQLSWDSFLDSLKDPLEASDASAFVFIHGYNVSFDKAARRTAQIAYDLDFKGAPMMFSWPSEGSLLAYLSDREDVEWSAVHIERFLSDLLKQARVRKLHLIAHSMGNQGLIRALYAMALRKAENTTPLFENVILAAPDFDAQRFNEQLAPEIISLAKRWTLYASDKDTALDASAALAAKRLGLPLSLAPGVDTVDASGVEVTPWSVPEFHSYYASKLRVLRDLIGVLDGLAPMERNLRKRGKDNLFYWTF